MSIRKFTAVNIIGAVVPMAVMLVTVPLYLKLLGEARFGVMSILWAILGYFSFFDLGLGKATANRIAQARTATAQRRADIVWTGFAINLMMGLIAATVLWLVGHYALGGLFKMSDALRIEALESLPWMVAALPLLLVMSVLTGALEGCNQFVLVNAIQVSGSTALQVVPLAVAFGVGPQLQYVVPAAVFSRALTVVPLLVACQRRVMPGSRMSLSRTEARPLVSFGGWVAFTGIVGILLETFDRMLIGATLGATATARYVVPQQLVGRFRVLPSALSRALFPDLSATRDTRSTTDGAIRALSVAATTAVILALAFVGPFLSVWVGQDIASIATPLAQIMLLGIWLNSLAYVPLVAIQARGRPDIAAKLSIAELPIFLIVLYGALTGFGLLGAAIAWSLRAVADALLLFHFARMLAGCARNLTMNGLLVMLAFSSAWLIPHYPTWMPLLVAVQAMLLLISIWKGLGFWRGLVRRSLDTRVGRSLSLTGRPRS